MLRSVKNIFWMLALAAGAQSAFGFALIGATDVAGTPDSFQIANIGYNVGGGEEGMPKRIHEGFRRNMPVVYYSFDESFWNYFGTNGVAAVEQAYAMYNSVGEVSQLDPNDYPEDSRRVNFQAEAVSLLDLKSFVMGLMTDQVGLFEPTRWVWALTERAVLAHPPGTPGCPFNMEYAVEGRNYGIVPTGPNEYPTSTYVNGVLYSYFIDEICQGAVPLADAVEFPVDPLSQPFSAVADFSSLDYAGLVPGGFYTSLTRDDVAGMKYIYATNNFAPEAAGTRVTEFITNDAPQIVTTQDLGALAAAAKVNNAAALQGLFPGLTILSTSNFFGLQITTNVTEVLLNSPLDPAGAPASHPHFSTNFTTNVVQFFVHTFGNIVTNTFATRGIVGTVSQNISNSPFAPAGSLPTTNTVVKLSQSPGVFGDFFILPTNTCSVLILSNMLTTVTPVTNLPTATSNAPVTGTNAIITFTPGSVNFLTNHTLIYLPVTCPINRIARRGGVDRLQFVARPYDAIISRVWDPITNNYTVTELDETNAVLVQRHFSRRVPRPDILFSTANFSSGQTATVTYSNTVDNATETKTFTLTIIGVGITFGFNTFAYDETGRPGNQAGPGTIIDDDPLPTLYVFNSSFPVFDVLSAATGATNSFIAPTEAQQAQFSAFGSFDGTTNAPVVYPHTTSFADLENLIVGPAPATPTLPDGNVGVPYSAQLVARSGTPPYTWSLAPNSPGLPGGLNISSDGKITGIPSGPAAIYDFTVRITDSIARFRDVQYTITIF